MAHGVVRSLTTESTIPLQKFLRDGMADADEDVIGMCEGISTDFMIFVKKRSRCVV